MRNLVVNHVLVENIFICLTHRGRIGFFRKKAFSIFHMFVARWNKIGEWSLKLKVIIIKFIHSIKFITLIRLVACLQQVIIVKHRIILIQHIVTKERKLSRGDAQFNQQLRIQGLYNTIS